MGDEVKLPEINVPGPSSIASRDTYPASLPLLFRTANTITMIISVKSARDPMTMPTIAPVERPSDDSETVGVGASVELVA